MKSNRSNTKWKEVQKALEIMPSVWKRVESQFHEEMKFSKTIFGPTVKEISKYRLAK